MRAAVVGHVEVVEFARVERMPGAGEIVTPAETWTEAAGGGAVAAVQLARLAGGATLFTALGDDPVGHSARKELERRGVHVECAWRRAPQRRAFTFLDAVGERTITVLGEKLVPRREDPLPWGELAAADAAFFVSGDVEALRAARAAGVLGATPRELDVLRDAAVPLDVVVGSGRDPGERVGPGDIDPEPSLLVATEGPRGGRWHAAAGDEGSYAATPVPTTPGSPDGPGDAYGCGDSFAATLVWALARGEQRERAFDLAARAGAGVAAGRGAYAGQLGAAELED